MILQTIKTRLDIRETHKPDLILLSFDMFEHGKG